MKKQPHITEQTKNNLRIAFWSLYAQKPIEKISIKEITELAGYNRGTFYLHYKDVFDLMDQIKNELIEEVESVLTHHPVPELVARRLRPLLSQLSMWFSFPFIYFCF